MARYQSKGLTMLFSKSLNLSNISPTWLCGLFFHLFFFYSVPTQLPHSTRSSLPFPPSFLAPTQTPVPEFSWTNPSARICFKLWMCLSMWEVLPFLALSPDPYLLCQDIKHMGLVLQLFVLHTWAALFYIHCMEPRRTALLGKRTHSLA